MYRVFCESLKNYTNIYHNNSLKTQFRYRITEPVSLLADIHRLEEERTKDSLTFMKSCDLLASMQESVGRYPRFKAFLWTLESRGMKPKRYNVLSRYEVEEQMKLINMLLKLMYWD